MKLKIAESILLIKPTFAERYLRIDNLGERYTAEAIKQRISNARNGIKEFYAPTLDYNFLA